MINYMNMINYRIKYTDTDLNEILLIVYTHMFQVNLNAIHIPQ